MDVWIRSISGEVLKNLPVWIVVGILEIAWDKIVKRRIGKKNGRPWSRGKKSLILSCVTIGLLYVYFESIGPSFSFGQISNETSSLVHKTRWIAYDPSEFNPQSGREPSISSILNDLEILRNSGFTGIITYSCRGSMRIIPVLAKRYGLKTIVGLWNPKNQEEIINALSIQKYADGYCVGNNGLDWDYGETDLYGAMDILKFRTLKPVSTTEPLKRYRNDQKLRRSVDWLFPDAHITMKEGRADVDRDTAATLDMATDICAVNEANKPILLKMILYPYNGIPGASPQAQEKFYRVLLKSRKDVKSGLPNQVSLAFYGFKDPAWKKGWPYEEWEPYTGLFETDGSERPAVGSIMNYFQR